jgi:hypothetical protein
MSNNTIDQSYSGYQPIFNYELIIKITLIILFPLGIFAILIARPFLMNFQKLFHNSKLTKKQIHSKTLLIKSTTSIVAILFFVI